MHKIILEMECQLPEISNSSMLNFTINSDGRATLGTNITFFCNEEGYNLTGGDNTATCTYTGEWSSPIPSCVKGKSASCVVSTIKYNKL